MRIVLQTEMKQKQQQSKYQQQFFYEKVPLDTSNTKFKWQKIKANNKSVTTTLKPPEVRQMVFQDKLKWFRGNLQQLRIPWTSGADFLHIDRANILYSSYNQAKQVNMLKEVKVQFLGEKTNDAGGLLREWIHMVIKEIFEEEVGIFTFAYTEDFTYKLVWDEELDEQYSTQILYLLGLLIAKSIFEKIPILPYLDRPLLKQICGLQPALEDIYAYDLGLYNSWTFIKKNEVENLDFKFSIHKQRKNSTVEEIDIIEEGKQIQVKQANKDIYINCCIQFYCCSSIKRSLAILKAGIHKIIPQELLSVFEPHQLQMILNGVPFIDINDWNINTVYKHPYNSHHEVIKWFWNQIEKMDQQQLARLLKFCTGSSRSPIQGFKHLQSNRGNFTKFTIESSEFTKANPYPKGHTCFSRLQLPQYPSQQALRQYLSPIINKDLDGVFGLD